MSPASPAALFGVTQPPVRPSEAQRHAQAQIVHDFVASIERVNPLAQVVVLGDLNDFEFSRTADILSSHLALVDLPRLLPPAERYTYVYEGASQVLDHILLSPALVLPARGQGPVGWRPGFDYDTVHLNAEFADQVSARPAGGAPDRPVAPGASGQPPRSRRVTRAHSSPSAERSRAGSMPKAPAGIGTS